MKKRFLLLFLVVTMVLAMPVQARVPSASPSLSFSGTTANCSIKVVGDKSTDEISVTLELWRGTTCLASWEDSGTGRLSMNETETVTKGYTYKLTADVTINGKTLPQVEVSARCS